LAYKDEYEVARLYLHPDFLAQIAERFEHPVRIDYHLHPPLLRRFGRTTKMRLGPWMRLVFRLLRNSRRVRGTALDPFGRLAPRREERELIRWYRGLLHDGLAALSAESLPRVIELAELPNAIRGYEDIKTRSAARARLHATGLLARLQPADELTPP
jgi:indolepyruvate ferredoxin oxidoreductase